jgi:hypothetical protein
VGGQIHAPAALPPPPGKEPPVPIGYEVGWTPEPVWTTFINSNQFSYCCYCNSSVHAIFPPLSIHLLVYVSNLSFFNLVCEAIGTEATPGLLCQPRVIVKMIVEKQIECRLTGEIEVLGENLPQRHFCPSQNPTWPDPGLNPGRRGGKPATNRLSYGAAFSNLFYPQVWGSPSFCFPISIWFKKKAILYFTTFENLWFSCNAILYCMVSAIKNLHHCDHLKYYVNNFCFVIFFKCSPYRKKFQIKLLLLWSVKGKVLCLVKHKDSKTRENGDKTLPFQRDTCTHWIRDWCSSGL